MAGSQDVTPISPAHPGECRDERFIGRSGAGPHWLTGAPNHRRARARVGFAADRRRLRIGLVNNLPDAAMEAAERQFLALMQAAAGGREVELVLFALDGVVRGEAGLARLVDRYAPPRNIEMAMIDALIVTGAEPRAARLQDEPFWDAFGQLLDAAEALELPVLFSCLAAHAAVLHRERIARRPLARKQSGVFAFAPACADRALEGMGARWTTPHSRWNGLDAAELSAAGYTVLGRSVDPVVDAGDDAFAARVGGARWLFLQGHPEYQAKTLLMETRRDLKRYLSGEGDTPPDLPHGLFGPHDLGATTLSGLLAEARLNRTPNLLDRWPAWAAPAPAAWAAPAAVLCRNWLASRDPERARERRAAPRPQLTA